MNIQLPAEQQAFIDKLVADHRFSTAGDAVSEAIRLLASREQLHEQIQVGVEEAARGEVVDHDTVFAGLRN
jgi:putative addiction module CopG family antidote